MDGWYTREPVVLEVPGERVWVSPESIVHEYLSSLGESLDSYEVMPCYETDRESVVFLLGGGRSLVEKTYQSLHERECIHLIASLSETPLLCYGSGAFIEEHVPERVGRSSPYRIKKRAARLLGEVLVRLHSLGLSYGDGFGGHVVTDGERVLLTDFGLVDSVVHGIDLDLENALEYLGSIGGSRAEQLSLEFWRAYERGF